MQRRSGVAVGAQSIHLVFHQGNQRAHADIDAGIASTRGGQRGHLVAEALAAARWHDHQAVAASNARGDRFGLQRTQGVESPDALDVVKDSGIKARVVLPEGVRPVRVLRGNERVRSHLVESRGACRHIRKSRRKRTDAQFIDGIPRHFG